MRSQIANAVTLARVVLVFPFWLALAQPGVVAASAAIACAFLIEMSDLLDGTIARRLGVVSDVGKLLDPAADSFSRLAVFLALATTPAPGTQEPWFPAWGVLLLLLRDVSVSFFRQVSASRGIVVAARPTGKLKALVQGAGIWTILALHLRSVVVGTRDARAGAVAYACCVVVVVVTLASLVDYAWGTRAAFTTRNDP